MSQKVFMSQRWLRCVIIIKEEKKYFMSKNISMSQRWYGMLCVCDVVKKNILSPKIFLCFKIFLCPKDGLRCCSNYEGRKKKLIPKKYFYVLKSFYVPEKVWDVKLLWRKKKYFKSKNISVPKNLYVPEMVWDV